MLERELSDLDGGEHICVSIDLNVVDAVDQVTDLVGLCEPHLNSFASHAQNSNCALWILLSLGLANDGCSILLAIPS